MFAAGLILGNLLKAAPQKASRRQAGEDGAYDENTGGTSSQADMSLAEGSPATTYGGV
jgi:hypothetical protein